jgi:hypothetical protein
VHPVDVARLRCDPAYGLKIFVAGYAYERSGAPRSYKTAAIKAVTAAGPHLEQIPAHYATFHPSPTNASNNPALDPRLGDLNVPGLVALVEQGALAEAYRRVIRLQGIGAKIAAFFVRDLVTLTSAEGAVDGLAGYVYAQPIDVWVRLTARALDLPLPLACPPCPCGLGRDDYAIAVSLSYAALEAGACPLRLNQGMWYICAHVIGDPQRLAVLLAARDVAVLERELSYLQGFVD